MWLHQKGTYQPNCYKGDSWDAAVCPDPVTCAANCALDAGNAGDYKSTYGVTSQGGSLTIDFEENNANGKNVGARLFMMKDASSYQMFQLMGQEFSFTVDVSALPCGMNGALYMVDMDEDGGMAKYPGNKAGAAYGTGYCDAQCPHDIKMINGQANMLGWDKNPNDPNSGTGSWGSCCSEMDIWESNSQAQAVTPHVCSGGATSGGSFKCNGTACGDDSKGERFKGLCDKDGCDLNPYRFGVKSFYGNSSSFAIDTTKPFQVVTQWITSDGSANGDLTEIRRKYVQGGKVIETPQVSVGGKQYNSVTDDFCVGQKKAFNNTNSFSQKGGLKAMGEVMKRGMVLVMSLWDDTSVNMLWLDSTYPPVAPGATPPPGNKRGPCGTESGVPSELQRDFPGAKVVFSDIKYGPLGSTIPGGGPTPPPPPGPPAPPAPPGGKCPGGSLSACMGLCPSSPPIVYKDCIQDCAKRCH